MLCFCAVKQRTCLFKHWFNPCRLAMKSNGLLMWKGMSWAENLTGTGGGVWYLMWHKGNGLMLQPAHLERVTRQPTYSGKKNVWVAGTLCVWASCSQKTEAYHPDPGPQLWLDLGRACPFTIEKKKEWGGKGGRSLGFSQETLRILKGLS